MRKFLAVCVVLSILGLTTDSGNGPVAVSIFPDNEPFDFAQIGGTAISVNSGSADAGTQRVILASDQDTVPVSSGRPSEEVKFASVTITGTGTTAIVVAVASRSIRIIQISSSYTAGGGTRNVGGVLHFGTRAVTSEFWGFDYPDFGGDAIAFTNDSGAEDPTQNQAVNITVDSINGSSPRLRFTIGYREIP